MKRINPLYVSFVLSFAFHSYLIGYDPFKIESGEPVEPMGVELREEMPEYLPEKYRLSQKKKIEVPVEEERLSENIIESEEVIKESILRYQDSVKQRIQEERKYPRRALRLKQEGVVKVSFNLLSLGEVKDIRLLESSGIDVLDTEAMDAVRRAGPFLPFPDDFKINELRFEISMVFRISETR